MDNSSVASVMTTTRNTSFDLTTLNIDPGVYYIWVSGSVGDMVNSLSPILNCVDFRVAGLAILRCK